MALISGEDKHLMSEEGKVNDKVAEELANKLIEICERYTVEQVCCATFNILMSAVDGNDDVGEKLATLSIVLQEVSKSYNQVIVDAHKPEKTVLQ